MTKNDFHWISVGYWRPFPYIKQHMPCVWGNNCTCTRGLNVKCRFCLSQVYSLDRFCCSVFLVNNSDLTSNSLFHFQKNITVSHTWGSMTMSFVQCVFYNASYKGTFASHLKLWLCCHRNRSTWVSWRLNRPWQIMFCWLVTCKGTRIVQALSSPLAVHMVAC